LSTSWEQFQRSLAGADRVADLLDEQPSPRDLPEAVPYRRPSSPLLSEKPAAIEAKARSFSRAEGDIVFQDVSFGYKPGIPVLEHINLRVPARRVVALVGPSGVGKSTLVSLIPRFYDPNEGCITLDGQDIKRLTLESLRQQISIVLQDVFLFHGNVRENILFGRPGASEAEVIEAARVANASGFIEGMPDGYNTIIGERGVKLSGGQKQRLSIARAVLKDAPMLILDEATSSVDTETELLIQQALERLMVGRTTIIIAHRLSTIRNADIIVVLEGRGIVEQGRHEELLARRGLYQKLYSIQANLEGVSASPEVPAGACEGPLTSG
jgi:ATP-binding cassette subfamily B protein/subfamily B ATP-binding cassette protein MsbA